MFYSFWLAFPSTKRCQRKIIGMGKDCTHGLCIKGLNWLALQKIQALLGVHLPQFIYQWYQIFKDGSLSAYRNAFSVLMRVDAQFSWVQTHQTALCDSWNMAQNLKVFRILPFNGVWWSCFIPEVFSSVLLCLITIEWNAKLN